MMNNLKDEMKIAFNNYKEKETIFNNYYDRIIGCLNRISVSDEQNEVDRLHRTLLAYLIDEYVVVARAQHKAFNEYEILFEKYRKVKNDEM